jgi:hypothetical protein
MYEKSLRISLSPKGEFSLLVKEGLKGELRGISQ